MWKYVLELFHEMCYHGYKALNYLCNDCCRFCNFLKEFNCKFSQCKYHCWWGSMWYVPCLGQPEPMVPVSKFHHTFVISCPFVSCKLLHCNHNVYIRSCWYLTYFISEHILMLDNNGFINQNYILGLMALLLPYLKLTLNTVPSLLLILDMAVVEAILKMFF